jgi:hypothetical protein
MKFRIYFILISVWLLLSFQTNTDSEQAKLFIQLLNTGKFEEAEKLTSPDFNVNFRHSGGVKTKKYFFDRCVKNASLKQFTIIDSVVNKDNRIIILGKDKSLLTDYLKLHLLPLRYTFLSNGTSINQLTIDSLPGYNDSLKINDRRWAYFERWSKVKHPDINLYYLKMQYNDSLLSLAKEFYQTIVKK